MNSQNRVADWYTKIHKGDVRECLELLMNPNLHITRRIALEERIKLLTPTDRDPLDWSTEP
jgi:hypothetical protein